ncbi:MAG: DUF1573 domain-containing protein [Bacteroidales bacterium]|jgi:hypothetical protein|nr:DUF1573 domain-containing protein [Bacteroidales bacterium]
MKKLLYLAVVAIMMMIADTASAQWTDIFNNPGGSTNKAELSTNKAATIQWEALEQNLGDVKQKVPTLVEFTFTNTGDKPVMILDAEASCGCTKLTFKREPVAPGKKGTISTVYVSEDGETGIFNKSITVKMSLAAPNDVYVLKLNGNVVK